MRSQDGSYLVEFIHSENMLLQVSLLMCAVQPELFSLCSSTLSSSF